MKSKGKILSVLFLLTYLSFLSHDLLGHHHHHLPADLFYHQLDKNNASGEIHHASCMHLLENCSTCSNDEKMHDLVYLSNDYKPDLLFIIPSVRIPIVFDPSSAEDIYITDEDVEVIPYHLVETLRGPPQFA